MQISIYSKETHVQRIPFQVITTLHRNGRQPNNHPFSTQTTAKKKKPKIKKRSKYIHQSSYRTKRGQYRKTFHSKKKKREKEKEEEEKKNNEPFNRIGESAKGIEKREAKNMVDKETWSAKDHGITWHGVSGKRSSRE